MTRRANARIAGYAFLIYIALGITAMVLFGRATGTEAIAGKLAGIAEHAAEVRLSALLTLFTGFCALTLGASLYAITRDQDPDLAMLGLVFRVGEGLLGVMAIQTPLRLLWLATTAGAEAPDPRSAHALGAFLLGGQGGAAANLFAVASTLFCWLLLRGRMIPSGLAWLGLIASVLWLVGFPLQFLRMLPGTFTYILWGLMAAFEVPFALWLIIKGVAPPARAQPA